MKRHKIILSVLLYLIIIGNSSAQYKSLDIGLSLSSFLDDHRDTEYDYDFVSGGALIHLPIGYTFSINEKMAFTPRIGFAYSLIQYHTGSQLFKFPNTIPNPNSLYIDKKQKIFFIKTGLAFSYWTKRVGKGFFFEADLQNLMLLSAISNNTKQVNGGEIQENRVDFENEVRKNVPSLRIGAGYNLPIKRFSFFLRIGLEFRLSTYFKSTDNYTFLNRSIGLGIRYAIQNKLNEP